MSDEDEFEDVVDTGKRTRKRNNSKVAAYDHVIAETFTRHYKEGETRLEFTKDEFVEILKENNLTVRNIPDIIYTYRIRKKLPQEILSKGHWAITGAGRGMYAFIKLKYPPHFEIPFSDYQIIDIYNSIPEVVDGLLRNDEQSLLTKVLYNRLVDIFTGLTCFHIQNHYRCYVDGSGEAEIDALYVGVDRLGKLYIIPVEAKSKGENEMLGRVQITQMSMMVGQVFPTLERKILAIKILPDDTIGVVEFNNSENPDDIKIESVSRYRLIRRTPGSPVLREW